MIEVSTDKPCPHCARHEDGGWFWPCPANDCPSRTDNTLKLVLAATRKFCDEHKADYADLLNSDSMDIDPEFMLLCHAVYGEPVQKDGKWVPGS